MDDTAFVVVLANHLIERRKASVMHIRSGYADIAERRRFELVFIGSIFRDVRIPHVFGFPGADSVIMELLIGEIISRMAGNAVGAVCIGKKLESVNNLRFVAENILIAIIVFIER